MGSLQQPVFPTVTTAMLSQWHSTRDPAHCDPQIATAKRIGSNSFGAITLVKVWMGKKVCKRRELESLLGHLQHAATVVRPGRTFVRRLIELLSVAKSKNSWVRLNASTRSDLTWWATFMEDWNGVAMMPIYSKPSVRLESDASGSWGCGAKWESRWLQWR